jgi:hypothetical protein
MILSRHIFELVAVDCCQNARTDTIDALRYESTRAASLGAINVARKGSV